MKKLGIVVSLTLLLVICGHAGAGEKTTPQEVIQKVREAAEYVAKNGESVFEKFNDSNGSWVWGGTYVFIMKGDEVALVTHPIKPKLIGKDLSGLKDKTGNYFFMQMCEAAKNPKGGWTEYWWPKPGEKKPSRKISYVLQIEGTPYQAGAGVYDDKVTLEELEKML